MLGTLYLYLNGTVLLTIWHSVWYTGILVNWYTDWHIGLLDYGQYDNVQSSQMCDNGRPSRSVTMVSLGFYPNGTVLDTLSFS